MGPGVPLLPEYRQAAVLYKNIRPYLEGSFEIAKRDDANSLLQADNWRMLLTMVRDETFRGSHLQRYKGLGEMNPEQLWETTMNPANRTLIQVHVDDMAVSDDMFTTLMGNKIDARREFIQSNALSAVDLDI